jgi:hypothetical protein
MVAQPANQSSLRLKQLAEDLYHEGEWIGKKAYRGYNALDFQTIVIRSVIEILFVLMNAYRNDKLSIQHRHQMVNRYIRRNKLGLEARRIRALVERIHPPCEEDPDYSRLKHDFRVQVQGLLDDKSRNLECEYQTIESLIKDKIAARPAKVFEKKVYEYTPPDAINPKKVGVYECFVVMPSNKGFYVLRYTAPEDIAEKYQGVFEKVISSFEALIK